RAKKLAIDIQRKPAAHTLQGNREGAILQEGEVGLGSPLGFLFHVITRRQKLPLAVGAAVSTADDLETEELAVDSLRLRQAIDLHQHLWYTGDRHPHPGDL